MISSINKLKFEASYKTTVIKNVVSEKGVRGVGGGGGACWTNCHCCP